MESLLSAKYYGNPSDKLLVVGITGTNGKTTTSYVIKNLLDYFFPPCGLIGTIENIVGKHHYPTTHTTPDVVSNHRLLHEMVKEKGRSVVMEVTSHALDQGRVDEIDFDVAVFSNLTQDHLDYHETMENYCSAKNRLFTNLNHKVKKNLKWAVVNQDDPWKSSILKGCTAQVLSYGIHNKADLQATRISLEANGTRSLLSYQGSSVEFFWPLIGRFNVYNCLAAISVLLTQSISLETIAAKMIGLPIVKGRLQSVSNQLGLKIYVDYAHTDDALINVLKTLKEIQTKGRIMVVFGCGGG